MVVAPIANQIGEMPMIRPTQTDVVDLLWDQLPTIRQHIREQWDVVKRDHIIARVLKRNPKDDPIQVALDVLLIRLAERLPDNVMALSVSLRAYPPSVATVTNPYTGEQERKPVKGMAALVGEYMTDTGATDRVYMRFISRPFWQWVGCGPRGQEEGDEE